MLPFVTFAMCREGAGLVWQSRGRGGGTFVPITWAPEFGPESEDKVDDNDGPGPGDGAADGAAVDNEPAGEKTVNKDELEVPDLVDSSDGAEDLSWVD